MTSQHATEAELATFLEPLGDGALPARSLVHAWQSGGGDVQIGSVATRLVGHHDGGTFTAATLHARDASLELCRVILERHGIAAAAWTHWSDEFADLAHHGFDARAKYPSIPLAPLTEAELARLVTGLRDLARLADA